MFVLKPFLKFRLAACIGGFQNRFRQRFNHVPLQSNTRADRWYQRKSTLRFKILVGQSNVCFWHKADMAIAISDVRFWGEQRTLSHKPLTAR
jgi:hypothetical protein